MTKAPSMDFYSLTGFLCVIVALVLLIIGVWASRNG
jgi:hypothetical protein